jgi:mRNA interferase RelE/StbE
MRILASDQVAGWLRNLPPEAKRRVRAALKALKRWQGDIKPLRGELEGFYRLRVGRYRIVCRMISRSLV